MGPEFERPATRSAAREDRRQAAIFLSAQSSWLRRGLEQAEQPGAVGIVLGRHDASHAAWLTLIRELRAGDGPSADAVAALYGFHGRLVGFLERGPDERLDPAVRLEVRCLLAARLQQLTGDAVATLQRDTDHPGATGSTLRPA